MIRHSLTIAVVLLMSATWQASAQEMTTDAERSWRDLRNSDDVKSKLMAERWYSAIRQQDWGDASGKFKTSAKYVEHDPQLKWVKLRVIQGAGEKRVVKDVQIPLEKLNKVCQARVRQIAKLSEKVAEAIEEEKKSDEEQDAADGPGEMASESRGGRGEYAGGRGEVEPEPVANERGGRGDGRGRAAATAVEPAVVTNNGPPLPAMLPKLPSPSVSSDAEVGAQEPGATDSEQFAGKEDWRTNYESFCANIHVTRRGRELFDFQWGPMRELQHAYEVKKRLEETGSVDERARAEIAQALADAGEVEWEATLAQAPSQRGDWSTTLGLAPPPEPWALSFILDPERGPGAWEGLAAGDQVRFAGRFLSFDEPHTLVIAIRFPPPANPADGGRSAESAPPTEPVSDNGGRR